MSSTEPGGQPSLSEDRGIKAMPTDAKQIYSIGASTGGVAEIRMARLLPGCHVITSTVDKQGAQAIAEIISGQGLAGQIEVKLENIAAPLPYPANHFDYCYGRLVLHYLTKQELAQALAGLYRVTKPGDKLFVVVRSTACASATREGSTYDDTTSLTTYPRKSKAGGKQEFRKRYFHTESTISEAIATSGFEIEHTQTYDEVLYDDFMHTRPSTFADNLIEVLARKKGQI